jgi:hypothetical protein
VAKEKAKPGQSGALCPREAAGHFFLTFSELPENTASSTYIVCVITLKFMNFRVIL